MMSKTSDLLLDSMEFFKNRRTHGIEVVRVYKEWDNGLLDMEEALLKISEVADPGSDAHEMANLLRGYDTSGV